MTHTGEILQVRTSWGARGWRGPLVERVTAQPYTGGVAFGKLPFRAAAPSLPPQPLLRKFGNAFTLDPASPSSEKSPGIILGAHSRLLGLLRVRLEKSKEGPKGRAVLYTDFWGCPYSHALRGQSRWGAAQGGGPAHGHPASPGVLRAGPPLPGAVLPRASFCSPDTGELLMHSWLLVPLPLHSWKSIPFWVPYFPLRGVLWDRSECVKMKSEKRPFLRQILLANRTLVLWGRFDKLTNCEGSYNNVASSVVTAGGRRVEGD